MNSRFTSIYATNKKNYQHLCKEITWRSDRYRLKNTVRINVPQIGGYITIREDMMDEIISMFNFKLFIEVVSQKPSPSDLTQRKPVYDRIAMITLTPDKYKKYQQLKSNNMNIYNTLQGQKSALELYYSKSSELFDKIYIYAKTGGLERSEKLEVLRELASIFDASFWKKIGHFESKDLMHPIFTFYDDDYKFSENDNVVVVDKMNYVLYKKGDISDPKTTKYFSFDVKSFTLTEIKDPDQIANVIVTAQKDLFVRSKFISSIGGVSIHDIYDIYSSILDVIRKYKDLATVKEDEKNVVDVINILPGTMSFLKNILNIGRGEITNRNVVIYSFLFTDNITMLLDLLNVAMSQQVNQIQENILIGDIAKTMRPEINKWFSDSLYARSESKSLSVDKTLYNILSESESLASLLNAYNYFYLIDLNNNVDMTNVKRDPYDMLYNFIKDLKMFLVSAQEFKEELVQYVGKINRNIHEHPNSFIIMMVVVYIMFVLREKSNIYLNKLKIIDQMCGVYRAMNAEHIPSEAEINTSRWVFGGSSAKTSFKRLREFFVTVRGDSFNSCGETMTLNLMNYILLDNNTKMFIVPESASDNLKKFYKHYNSLDEMFKDEKGSVSAWAALISGIGNVNYNKQQCELIPDSGNVFRLFKRLLPAHTEHTEKNSINNIIQMIAKIDPVVKVGYKKESPFEILLVDDYCVRFSSRHGDMIVCATPKKENQNPMLKNHRDVANAIINTNGDIVSRVIFFCRTDLVKTKKFMDAFMRHSGYFNYLMMHYDNQLVDAILFNEFTDPHIVVLVVESLNIKNRDIDANVQTNIAKTIENMFEKIRSTPTLSQYLDKIFEYVENNRDGVSPSVLTCKRFLLSLESDVYIATAEKSTHPILTTISVGRDQKIISSLVKTQKGHIEVNVPQRFSDIMSYVIKTNSDVLFEEIVHIIDVDLAKLNVFAHLDDEYNKFSILMKKYVVSHERLIEIISLSFSDKHISWKRSNNLKRYVGELDYGDFINALEVGKVNNPLAVAVFYRNPKLFTIDGSSKYYIDRSMFEKELHDKEGMRQHLIVTSGYEKIEELKMFQGFINSKYVNNNILESILQNITTQRAMDLILERFRTTDLALLSKVIERYILAESPQKVIAKPKPYGRDGDYDYSVDRDRLMTNYASLIPKDQFNVILSNTTYTNKPIYALLVTKRFNDLKEYLTRSPKLDETKIDDHTETLLLLCSADKYRELILYMMTNQVLSYKVLRSVLKNSEYAFLRDSILDPHNDIRKFHKSNITTIYLVSKEVRKEEVYRYSEKDPFESIIHKFPTKVFAQILAETEKRPLVVAMGLYRTDVLVELLSSPDTTKELDEKDGYENFYNKLIKLLGRERDGENLQKLFDGINKNIKIISLINRYAEMMESESIEQSMPEQVSNTILFLITHFTNNITEQSDVYLELINSIRQHMKYLSNMLFKKNFNVPEAYKKHVVDILNNLNTFAYDLTKKYNVYEDVRYGLENVYLEIAYSVVNLCRGILKLTTSQIDLALSVITLVNEYSINFDNTGLQLLNKIPEAYLFLLNYRLNDILGDDSYGFAPSDDVISEVKYVVLTDDIYSMRDRNLSEDKTRELVRVVEPLVGSHNREFSKKRWETLEKVRIAINKSPEKVIDTLFHNMMSEFRVKDDSYTYDKYMFSENNQLMSIHHVLEHDDDEDEDDYQIEQGGISDDESDIVLVDEDYDVDDDRVDDDRVYDDSFE